MVEVDAGKTEDKEVYDMFVDVAIYMVAKEDVGEGAMVITHMNAPAGTYN